MSLPKPYYQRGPVTLYHGDCLELLPSLPRVDAVVTDPPYGIGISSNPVRQAHEKFNWDDCPANPKTIEILSSFQNVVIWGGNYFGLPATQCLLIWDKQQPENFSLAMAEVAWTNLKLPAKMFRFRVVGYQKDHPTQKPVPLIEWCIDYASTEGDTILDPFLGSGTTAVACIRTGRQCIGIELEEKYCEIAAKRCDRELDQKRLPFDTPKRTETQRELFAEVTA